jgi:DNA-binding protein HU-beta
MLPGLGKMIKAKRKARMGRNPKTGEPMKIAAKTTAKFRLCKAAKEAVLK